MENLIGRKVRGFNFKYIDNSLDYISRMNKHIGEIGVIEDFDEIDKTIKVKFKDASWYYPLSEIEKHLVEEFERGEWVEVRNSVGSEWTPGIFLTEIESSKYPFICVTGTDAEKFKSNEQFFTNNWKQIRKLKTKITLEEISKVFGVDVDKIEIVD